MKILFLIPARGGSKGIPNKNQKLLNGKPLLFYSIDMARKFVADEHICVSTDSDSIAKLCSDYGLKIPFNRPAKFATDKASTASVIAHALAHYKKQKCTYDALVLLQPTSPFRTEKQVKDALKLYTENMDMLVTVHESAANPYYNLMEENKSGFLHKSKKSAQAITRRQDAPPVYLINGAIYIINVKSFLKKGNLSQFTRVKKFVIPEQDALDIDTPADWDFATYLLSKNKSKLKK